MELEISTGSPDRAREVDSIRAREARSLARWRARDQQELRREALARAIGADDPALVDLLLGAGIDPEAFLAFELLPLVEMAWVDGRVEDAERLAVLEAATDLGVKLGSPAHALLESWLRVPPAQRLHEGWRSWFSRKSEGVFDELIVAYASEVAEASGGFLSMARVSSREQELIRRIRLAIQAREDRS